MALLAGRYVLGGQIAQGGTSTVHHGDDKVLRRPVAVKIRTSQRGDDSTAHGAVWREAVTGARLSHPNVARVYDYGEAAWQGRSRPFLVMEYVPGGTLAARLAERGPVPWWEAVRICTDVARALAATHDLDLVHRDVKPGNIMLSPSGAKVVDFGLATRTGDRMTDADGRMWGTPAYFAPEQLHGAAVDAKVDVYALGLVLHACLTGGPAWTGTSVEGVLIARALSPVPTLPGDCDVPDRLVALHRRCLSPQPGKRPTSRRVVRLLREATGQVSRKVVAAPSGTARLRLPVAAIPGHASPR